LLKPVCRQSTLARGETKEDWRSRPRDRRSRVTGTMRRAYERTFSGPGRTLARQAVAAAMVPFVLALRRAAELVEGVIRDSDFAFRYGGEEFLVVLPGADADQATRVAERLRAEMNHSRFDVGEHTIDLRASFGVAQCRPQQATWDDCVAAADRALYAAKRAGRNRVVTLPEQPPGQG